MTLFTQFKQWISLKPSSTYKAAAGVAAVAGQDAQAFGGLGTYFERVQGGEPSYSMAEAALANSRGMVYRTTRFRISELTLENVMDITSFSAFSAVFESFRKDGNQKMTVVRTINDGDKGVLRYEYGFCSVMSPPHIDDGDVARDNEFLTMRIRLQPESLIVTNVGTKQILLQLTPTDTLDSGAYFKLGESGTKGSPA
jgi:hypothetical protein